MFEPQKEKRRRLLDHIQHNHATAYFFGDLLVNITVIVLLVYIVRTFFISPFQVYGPSMCDTLNYLNDECQDAFGEYLIVNKAVYYPFFDHGFRDPKRGDIIVFRPPHNDEDFYIKRIIGLPGEKVKIQNGKVMIINKDRQAGFELNETYLGATNKNQTYSLTTQSINTYEVPAGHYFVMGDNRKKSTDSRSCFKGPGYESCENPNSIDHFLPLSRIEGKAWLVLWPFDKARALSEPQYE